MAVDASILAIPGLGSQIATKALCSVSFTFSVYCIISCMMAQYFGYRMRSLDFAVRFASILHPGPDVIVLIGILYAREDVQTYHSRKYTKLSVFNEVTKH
jgi:hypothetical protein